MNHGCSLLAKIGWFSLCLILIGCANTNKRGLAQWSVNNQQNSAIYTAGNNHALLIGNNIYNDKNGVWKNLNTANHGAVQLAELLKTKYNFTNISLLNNASRKEILVALNHISDSLSPNDSVLIYYAGHGYLEEEKQRGYWIPSDASGGDSTTYLRNSTIRDEINIIASRSTHTLVIADSCFSGELMRGNTRSVNELSDELSQSGYYKKVGSRKSVQIFSAGGSEFVDDSYRDSGYSPFTYFLINELTHNTKPLVSLAEIATNVSILVANNVDQTPQMGVLLGAGDEMGQFVFTRMEEKIPPPIEKDDTTEQASTDEPLSPTIEENRYIPVFTL